MTKVRINGEYWYIWSDNIDEGTITCLPYDYGDERYDSEGFFVYDMKTFDKSDINKE